MENEGTYSIGFFLKGNYHMLCLERGEYRFHIIEPHSYFKPVQYDFQEARKFIETHSVCSNIAHHDIRIMPYNEVRNILEGKTAASTVKSLQLSSEDEDEEPLH